MKNKLLIIFSILSFVLNAQDNEVPIITDRPTQSESSTVVPVNTLQIETGFLLENNNGNLIDVRSYKYNNTILRYGLLENFELRLGFDYVGLKTTDNTASTSSSISGFNPLYTGFKVKVRDEDGWKPEMAISGAIVLPFTAKDDFKPNHSAASMRFSFSNTLSDKLALGYNLGAHWDGDTAIPSYFYSLCLSTGLSDKLSAFLESYAYFPEGARAEHLINTGLTFLLMPTLQLDLSGGIGLNDNATDNFISFGLSYRLPK